MGLSKDLVSQFVKSTHDNNTTKTESTLNGTVKIVGEGANAVTYVRLDGSNVDTPVSSSTEVQNNERVTVSLKDHQATIIANNSNPATTTTGSTITGINNTLGSFSTIIADKADIEYLEANYAHMTNGIIDNAYIDQAKVNNLAANYAKIENGVITNANIDVAKVNNLAANYARIENGVITNAKIDVADVNRISATYAQLDLANVNNAWIQNGVIKDAAIDQAKINNLDVDYAQADFANVTVGWINNGVIDTGVIQTGMIADGAIVNAKILDGTITNAKIHDLSASKLTAGTIDASNITVNNLNASNITAGTLNGQRLGTGSIDLDKLAEEVTTKEDFDDAVEELNQRIDGAIETWTTSTVPSLNNYPAVDWTDNATKKQHVGDICYVINDQIQQDGYCYRFAEITTNNFEWILIKDSAVTRALSDISDMQGDITDIQADIGDIEIWQGTTDDSIDQIITNHNSLSVVVDKTVKSSIQLWYTKANTTAPSAPTSQVTSTSTAGNAWRVVVPEYNASYKYYFYCWQYEFVDGSYGWSTVVRDLGMEETQSQARQGVADAASAQNTANANIKSNVMIWYTKANTTAPSKPTSQVTSTSTSGGAWRLVVPTYNSSYPYYFYCYQQQKGDGTYQWTDVVYDRATSENQANSRSALSQVSTKVETSTFNTLSSTVDSHTNSIGQLTTITTNNGLTDSTNITSTVSTLSNTVDGMSSDVSNLQTITTNNGLTSSTNITSSVSTLSNNLSGVTGRVSSLETVNTNNGLTSSTNITNQVSQLNLDLQGYKTTVSSTYAEKEDLDDLESAITAVDVRESNFEQTVNGFRTSVEETIADINQNVSANSTQITQTANSINAVVTSVNTLNADFSSYQETNDENISNLQTGLDNANEDIIANNTALSNSIENVRSIAQNVSDNVSTYMTFDSDGLELGKSDSTIKVNIKNDRLSFSDNNNEVAYISNEMLYIENEQVLKNLRFGNFVFFERQGSDYLNDGVSHNMGLKWIN